MKLRIHGNSIRLRLSQADVATFNDHGQVESAIDFGTADGKLVYRLQADAGLESPTAEFQTNVVVIRVPRGIAGAWSRSEMVGIKSQHATDTGRVLRILVEKDFACLKTREGEDDTDTFPNPIMGRLF